MKKLLFATAIAASAAAFAIDPFNAISFESYTPGATFANGATENNEFAKTASEKYFYFQGDSNSSVVTNGLNLPAGVTRPKWFADNPGTGNDNYLALDTEGGTFWRSINDITNETTTVGEQETTTYGLGAAQTVGDGIYLDTMVQFTVTEDEEPTVGADDKLAIWLGVVTNAQGEVTGTNLMVKAAIVNGASRTPTSFVLNASVEPGIWYRLTVKAFTDITDEDRIPGFQIFLDGNVLASDTVTLAGESLSTLAPEEFDDSHYADIVAGKYFASLKTATTIQGVGFQGTGALDDLVLTTEDPFAGVAPTVVDFTLTLTTDQYVAGVEITTNDVAVVFDNGAAQIPSNTVVKVAALTFTTGYQLASFSVGGVAVDPPTFPYEFTMEAATEVAVAAEQTPAAYPAYCHDDATLKSQYDTWKTTNGADSESAYEKQFLLNVAPSTTVADDALVIESITENATAGAWDIVVSTTVTGAALSDGSATTYNGYLLVKAANDLASLESATPTAYTVTAVTGGKVKITVTAGKFMKAVLTTTAPTPAAGN